MGFGIGFYPTGGRTWYAGMVTFKALIDAIRANYSETVRCYLMRIGDPPGVPPEDSLISCPSILIQPVQDPNPAGKADRPIDQAHSRGMAEDAALREYKIDVIFGRAGSCEFSKARKLIWITDFQHKYTPEIYAPQGCRERDRQLRN